MKKQFSIELAAPSDLEAADIVFESSISAAFEQEGLEALIDDIQQEIKHKKQLLRASLSALNPDLFFLTVPNITITLLERSLMALVEKKSGSALTTSSSMWGLWGVCMCCPVIRDRE